MMMWFLACSGTPFSIPQSDIFQEEQGWSGSLSFVSEDCASVYQLSGTEQDCVECLVEIQFILSPLKEGCLFDGLQLLNFRVSSNQEWLVEEETGWEVWGDAQQNDELWELRSTFPFYSIQ